MDLALELGMTVREIKSRMTTRELGMWTIYAQQKLLPTRRLEFYLARIAQVTAGGPLKDYLFDFRPPKAEQGGAVVAAEVLGNLAGGKVIRIRKVK